MSWARLPESPSAIGSSEIATAPAIVGQALPNRSMTRSANAATNTSPTGPASRATPSSPSDRPRCCLTAGIRASHTPSARPSTMKYAATARRARRRLSGTVPGAVAALGAVEGPMSRTIQD
jgi:hypothetical protein